MNIRNIHTNYDWVHNNNNKMGKYGKDMNLNKRTDQEKENFINKKQIQEHLIKIDKQDVNSPKARFELKYSEQYVYHHQIREFMRNKQQFDRMVNILKVWNIRRNNNYIFRQQVVSYLFEMVSKYGYKRQSLYLAITIYDKYALTNAAFDQKQISEIATTCLLIAGKYIEYIPPNLKKIKINSHHSAILNRQAQILSVLNFNLSKYTVHNHFQYLLQLYDIPREQAEFARFILDHCLFNYKLFSLTKPQILAYGMFDIVCQLLNITFPEQDCVFIQTSVTCCSNLIMKVFKEIFLKFRKLTERNNSRIKINRYYNIL